MHGSPVLVSAVLDCLCAKGARLAEPGEFTLRAFLRGRMDLSQAEAVQDIIEAKTLYQAQVAARQRSGELARQLEPVKTLLIDIIVQLECALEFVEENLPLESREALGAKLEGLQGQLGAWIESYRRGRLIRDGFTMAIVGRSNVGKSSLFNALLRQERSIVSEIPGTTRDLVSEEMSLDGVPVRLLDTAGVRVSGDRVEQLGVDRSLRAMAEADALLLVLDRSAPRAEEDGTNRVSGVAQPRRRADEGQRVEPVPDAAAPERDEIVVPDAGHDAAQRGRGLHGWLGGEAERNDIDQGAAIRGCR